MQAKFFRLQKVHAAREMKCTKCVRCMHAFTQTSGRNVWCMHRQLNILTGFSNALDCYL